MTLGYRGFLPSLLFGCRIKALSLRGRRFGKLFLLRSVGQYGLKGIIGSLKEWQSLLFRYTCELRTKLFGGACIVGSVFGSAGDLKRMD